MESFSAPVLIVQAILSGSRIRGRGLGLSLPLPLLAFNDGRFISWLNTFDIGTAAIYTAIHILGVFWDSSSNADELSYFWREVLLHRTAMPYQTAAASMTMNPIEWYYIVICALLGLPCLVFAFVTLAEAAKSFLFRSRLHRCFGTLALWLEPDVLLSLLFVVANVVPMAYGVKDAGTFMQNSGRITIAGLVPLSLGGQISPIPNAIGLRFDTFAKFHRWLGRLTIIEGIIHVVFAWSLHLPDARASQSIAGIIVGFMSWSSSNR